MNGDRAAGDWKQIKGRVKQKWANRTDGDLTCDNGQRDELPARIEARYAIAKDRAGKQVKDREKGFWARRNCPLWAIQSLPDASTLRL